MGGGVAARYLGRFSGFTARRGVQSHFSEQAAVGLQATRPGSGIASTAVAEAPGASAPVQLSSSYVGNEGPAVQRPAWELDDWELAGENDAEPFCRGNQSPRLVFGPPPSLQEARDATSDLKDALEMMSLSSLGGGAAGETQGLVGTSMDNSLIKSCLTSQSKAAIASIPKPVINAYSLLKESPEAQNIVAALAADNNVWEAVMKNEKVMEFCRSYRASDSARQLNIDLEPLAEGSAETTHRCDGEAESGNNGFMENIRLKVAEMLSSVSYFFQDIFGAREEERSSAEGKRNSSDFTDKAFGASFLVLAILAIIVVLFKRN